MPNTPMTRSLQTPPSRVGDATPRRTGGGVVSGCRMPNRAELVAVLLQNLQNTTEVLVSLNESSNGELKDAMTLVRKLQRQQNRMFASLGMPPGDEEDEDEDAEPWDGTHSFQDKFRLEESNSEAKFLMGARAEEGARLPPVPPTPKTPAPSIKPRSTKKTLAKAQHTLANFQHAEAAHAEKTPKKSTPSINPKSTTKTRTPTTIQHSPAALKRKQDIADMQRLNTESIAARVATTPKAKPASTGAKASTGRKRPADSELSRAVGRSKKA